MIFHGQHPKTISGSSQNVLVHSEFLHRASLLPLYPASSSSFLWSFWTPNPLWLYKTCHDPVYFECDESSSIVCDQRLKTALGIRQVLAILFPLILAVFFIHSEASSTHLLKILSASFVAINNGNCVHYSLLRFDTASRIFLYTLECLSFQTYFSMILSLLLSCTILAYICLVETDMEFYRHVVRFE